MIEQTRWLERKRSASKTARNAMTSPSRLIHDDLAGRYSLKAALCPPFMLPRSAPSTEGERAALQIQAQRARPLEPSIRSPGLRREVGGDRSSGQGRRSGLSQHLA